MRTSTLFTALWLILAAAGCTRPEFRPGAVWTDTGGAVINAHGGGILYDEGRYYWFGEHKTAGEAGNLAQVGVHCYSASGAAPTGATKASPWPWLPKARAARSKKAASSNARR